MSQPESNKHSTKWMMVAMVCCAIPIVVSLLLLGVFLGRSSQQPNRNPPVKPTTTKFESQPAASAASVSLEPAGNWRSENHVHGLAIHPQNSGIIYVATHNGLLQRSEQGQWFWMGKQRADYMGFTADPTNAQRFYSSGHPPTGGNLGFQISDTQGEAWQQISLPGVDFHALALAPSNPKIFYGWPASGAEGLHLSTDGGKTWTKPRMAGLGDAPFELAVDPSNPNHVFAATRTGLYESTNQGNNWTLLPNTREAPVVGLALLGTNNNLVMTGYRIFSDAPGLYRSMDGGKTWGKLWADTKGVVLKVAIAASNPQILYAINENNTVFQSQDGGQTWNELG
jgi:photosystem II stability/assembly factor-like uncharacterized protein